MKCAKQTYAGFSSFQDVKNATVVVISSLIIVTMRALNSRDRFALVVGHSNAARWVWADGGTISARLARFSFS